jgi:hypothetical protein
MTAIDQLVAALSAIVEEVAGAGQPFSGESYLPPHLIHDAREAIASAEGEQQ